MKRQVLDSSGDGRCDTRRLNMDDNQASRLEILMPLTINLTNCSSFKILA